jgi:hypothetical protein
MKWIVLLLILVGGGYAIWAYTSSHPAARACGHFADLCGADSRKQCDDAFDAFGKAASPEQLAPSVKCLQEATTCAQAAGCLAGAAGRAGVNAAGEFIKGLGESLKQ